MKKNFTMLELLITISIIMILAALLLPALGAARNRAHAAECLGRLRQNTSGMHMYSMDYDGLMVTYMKADTGSTISWSMALYNGKYIPGTSYLATKTFVCPSLPPEGFHDPYRTYGSLKFNDKWEADFFELGKGWGNFMMREIASATQELYYSSHKLKMPSKALHFADTMYANPGNAEHGFGFYYMPLRVKVNATLSVHHNRRANIAFFDGHAVSMSDAALLAEEITALVVNGKKLE